MSNTLQIIHLRGHEQRVKSTLHKTKYIKDQKNWIFLVSSSRKFVFLVPIPVIWAIHFYVVWLWWGWPLSPFSSDIFSMLFMGFRFWSLWWQTQWGHSGPGSGLHPTHKYLPRPCFEVLLTLWQFYLFILNNFLHVILPEDITANTHWFHCSLSLLLRCLMQRGRDFTCSVHFCIFHKHMWKQHVCTYIGTNPRIWKVTKWKEWRDNETRLNWVFLKQP